MQLEHRLSNAVGAAPTTSSSPHPHPTHIPDQNVYRARPHFREKGFFFQWEARNQEKGVILKAWVREIFKKGKILHVFITVYLFRIFE